MRSVSVMMFAAGVCSLLADPNTSARPDDLTSNIVREANIVRRMHGQPPIADDPSLSVIANQHSRNMAEHFFWGHIDPEGRTPSKRVSDSDPTFRGSVAENLWKCEHCSRIGPEELPKRVVAAWLNSPGHRKNLLDGKITHMGIGVSVLRDTIHVTQLLAVRPQTSARGVQPAKLSPTDLR